MIIRWLLVTLFLASLTSLSAQETKKELEKKVDEKFVARPGIVPFRLTEMNHTVVRVKINGKGPFNFVVDTGCPVFLISEPVGKKIGLKTDMKADKFWATLDKLEIEGGLELTNVKARVETPFQIEGMNALGVSGIELHGLMGYTVLAKFKMDYDYTKKQLVWTPVKTEPLQPMPLGAKKGSAAGMDMMEMLGPILRIYSAIAGIGPGPPPQPRGFFGFELDQGDKEVRVALVLVGSPAADAGLKKGDRIVRVGSAQDVTFVSDVLQQAGKVTAGKTLSITVEREKEKHELKIKAGDGL